MKLSTKSHDPKSLGFYILFSITPAEKFQVIFDDRSCIRATVNIALPSAFPQKWLAGFNTILRQFQCGNHWPVRLEYDNTLQFFTLEQIKSIEKANPAVTFYLYDVPSRVADSETSSSLDFDKIRNKLARERYAAEREQRIQERNVRACAGNAR